MLVALGATRSTTVTALAYARPKEHLGTAGGEAYVFDPLLHLADVEEAVRGRLGRDAVMLADSLLDSRRAHALPNGTLAKIPSSFRLVTGILVLQRHFVILRSGATKNPGCTGRLATPRLGFFAPSGRSE